MNTTAHKLEYRGPEVPHPPPRMRIGLVSIGMSLFCYGGLGLTQFQIIDIDLEFIFWTFVIAVIVAMVGLFQRGGRILSAAALIIAAIGVIYLPMFVLR